MCPFYIGVRLIEVSVKRESTVDSFFKQCDTLKRKQHVKC